MSSNRYFANRPFATTMPSAVLSSIALTLTLSACHQKPAEVKDQKPAIASAANTAVIIADAPATLPPAPKAIQQLDVPVYVEGTNLLLHPLITLYTDDKGSIVQRSSENNGGSGFFEPINRFDYHCNIDNLIIENIETGKTTQIFAHNRYNINRVFFPYTDKSGGETEKTITPKHPTKLANTAQQNTPSSHKTTIKPLSIDPATATLLPRIIYEVNEAAPTQRTSNDTLSSYAKTGNERNGLYMSDDKGNGITRLHPANQFLMNSKWVAPLQRFYFVTQADSDNNGKLDDKDNVYYYYIDFGSEMPVIRQYNF